MSDTNSYQYIVTVWNAQGTSAAGTSKSASANACSKISSGFLIQSKVDGSFELLFPQSACINHYRHKKGSILTGHWKHVHTLYAPEGGAIPDNAVSLIESTSGNLEAVAVVTPPDKGRNYLVSYEFAPESGWQEPSILKGDGAFITGATGTPAFIQTREGPYQLFVPQGDFIGRYMHREGSIQDSVWMPLPPLGTSDTLTYTAISLVQTTSDQLELIARVTPTQTPQQDVIPDYLVSFVSSSTDPQTTFQHVGPLLADGQSITGVTGTPSFIQDARGIFELVVPHSALMDQYILETDSIGANLWKHVSTLEPLKNDPRIQFTATSLIQSTSGKLDLVARATPPQGEGEDYPVTYEFTGWKGPRPIIVDSRSSDEDKDKDKQDTD
jgi:hypothetical protein